VQVNLGGCATDRNGTSISDLLQPYSDSALSVGINHGSGWGVEATNTVFVKQVAVSYGPRARPEGDGAGRGGVDQAAERAGEFGRLRDRPERGSDLLQPYSDSALSVGINHGSGWGVEATNTVFV
jgi:hypothetical protein